MEGISEGAATVIEDNGCLSQQLLSKEGGWEEEEGGGATMTCACAGYNVILRLLNILKHYETKG